MIRETIRQKQKRLRLQKRRALKLQIRKDILSGKLIKVPKKFRNAISFSCPQNLSLNSNFKEALFFFNELKELSNFILQRRKYRPTTDVSYSIGLTSLHTISVRCAVILAAEIDRLRRVSGDKLHYNGHIDNDNEAISLLRQMGVFQLIGGDIRLPPEPKDALGHRVAIPIISGTKCREEKFTEFDTAVKGIFQAYDNEFVHCGMVEAMVNVTNHAYLNKYSLKYPCPGKRWWAAAILDTELSELKVIIFDQGHGIATTLPSSGLIQKIEMIAGKLLGKITKYADTPDEILINAALEFSRSRTKRDERGKGFKDIQDPIGTVAGSRLRVTSGKAQVTLKNGCDTVSLPLDAHIGGTLIEWVFPIRNIQQNLTEAI